MVSSNGFPKETSAQESDLSEAKLLRLPKDLFTSFMDVTREDNVPEVFKRWSAISLIGGALERRVWTRTGSHGGLSRYTFPNLYVLLIAPPGTGKSVIDVISDFWRETVQPGTTTPAFKIAPTNMTRAAL